MSEAGGNAVKQGGRSKHNGSIDQSESPQGRADREPDTQPTEDVQHRGIQALRNAAAIGYVPIAITEQLLSRSQPIVYYAGVAALAAAGAIDWPVAGVVAAGVWVARRSAAVGT